MRGGCGHERDAEMEGMARSDEKYLSYFLEMSVWGRAMRAGRVSL